MNPADLLRYGQAQIDDLIDRCTLADWAAIALGTWTTKDLVGHLGAYEVRFAEVLSLFAGVEPATNLRTESPTTFNDDQAAIRRDWSVESIVAEIRDAHALSTSLVGRIPAETWREVGTIPWYGPEYSLDDLLVYSLYGHKREHGPQLEAVLERSVA
ncbi:MAG: maleylpyruvate isomerase N-terminal domain-containing protein [Chloroflexota bacterium]|nr:maleylpyruvate isomerase N-terminal domain-containing protein [Chloroflexota bacterium]